MSHQSAAVMQPVEAVDGAEGQLFDIDPERFGELLASARRSEDVPRTEVAGRLMWSYGPTVLAMIEQGRYEIPQEDISLVVWGYGIDAEALLPSRDALVVDVGRRRLRIGKHKKRIGNSIDDVLSKYLSLIRALRDLPPNMGIKAEQLRTDDLVELSGALAVDVSEVQTRLVELVQLPRRGRHVGGPLALLPAPPPQFVERLEAHTVIATAS